MRLWAAEAVGDKALRSDWHATARRFMRSDADAKRAGKGKPTKVAPLGKTVHVKRDSPQGLGGLGGLHESDNWPLATDG